MQDKKRILLIDDDSDLVAIWMRFLQLEGYDVHTAGDGGEGLKAAKEGGFDLIIVDEMMPKVDGLAFLTELSYAEPKPNNGAIVMITSLSTEAVCENAKALGASACINKVDLDPEMFVKKVGEFVRK